MVCSARSLVCCFWLYDLNQIVITKKQVICFWHFPFLPELISNCASVICLSHLKLAFFIICLRAGECLCSKKNAKSLPKLYPMCLLTTARTLTTHSTGNHIIETVVHCRKEELNEMNLSLRACNKMSIGLCI